MFLAVSALSPVITHIFIFANFKTSIVSYKFSYNLSSIPLAPIKYKLSSKLYLYSYIY